ncbi:hypothetical protein ACTA71_006059 [Dictyostelium dimigraforme]
MILNYESPLALPVIGHFLHIKKDPHLVVHKDRKKFNKGRFIKYWFGDYLTMAITDPKLYKDIYLKFPNLVKIKRIENIYYSSFRNEQNEMMNSIIELIDSVGVQRIENYLKFTHPFVYLYLKIFKDKSYNLKKILKKHYDEHLSTIDFNRPRDVLDSIIIEYKKKNVKECEKAFVSIGIDLIGAGSETNSTTCQWLFIYLINYPIYQDRIYDELIKALDINKPIDGRNVLINLSHRQLTPLFNATLKEVLRLNPATPFSLPRVTNEEFHVDGLKIPKGTYLFPSLYSIFRDESYWGEKSNDFYPERFLSQLHSNHFFPYSIGKRMCIGSNFSQDELYICLTNILLNFKIKSIDGKPLNEIPNYGLTFRPNNFKVTLETR